MTCREKIIEALRIAEEVDPGGFTAADHDMIMIMAPGDEELTETQKQRLDELGFICSDEYGWYCFT